MAYEIPGTCKLSLWAGADLRLYQYYFVTVNTDGEVELINSLTADYPIGILQNTPNHDELAEIMTIGVSKVSVDAAVTAAALVGPSVDGQAVSKTLVVGNNLNWVSGVALDSTTTAGQKGTILLRRPFKMMIEA